MTSKQKIADIKRLMPTEQVAEILGVSVPTVESWTRSAKGARNPWGRNKERIDALYGQLKPCFDKIENIQKGGRL